MPQPAQAPTSPPPASWEHLQGRVERLDDQCGPATIFGTTMSIDAAKNRFNGKITRHHIIDIGMFPKIWNKAVKDDDEDMIDALADWANAKAQLPAKPYNMKATSPPQRLLKLIAWNPFNIVIGPLTNYRIGDPGNDFDDVRFRTLPAFSQQGGQPASLLDRNNKQESVMRQEFNMHMDRLRRIYNLAREYVDEQFPSTDSTGTNTKPVSKYKFAVSSGSSPAIAQNRLSLITLLKSDKPTSYPALSVGLGTAGALLHPDLWCVYSLTPEQAKTIKPNKNDPPEMKKAQSDIKKAKNAITAKFVPYSSQGFHPDIVVKPKQQSHLPPPLPPRPHRSLDPLKSPPTTAPLIDIPVVNPASMRVLTCQQMLKTKLLPLKRFMAGGGVQVLICGPEDSDQFKALVKTVGSAVERLKVGEGQNITYSPMARRAFQKLELRIYLR